MKFTDLREKGPVIGAPRGSQKDSRLSPGTDDPSKYMRGGEWEAYREPQGVNSNAGKIAGGKTKGTTKTKNKKTSEGLGDMFSPEAKELRRYKRDPDAALEDGNSFLNAAISVARDGGNKKLEDKLSMVRMAFLRHMNTGEYKGALSMMNHAYTLRSSLLPEGIQSGGPGVSGDMVPRDPHATTIAMVKDTLDPNIKKGPKLAGSEAPTKFVKKQIKKSLDNRPGNVSDINEAVNKILAEAIPRVIPQDYSADYDLRDDKNQESIGVASITHGVIELLSVRNDVVEDYNGHIMSRLLSTIVRDADAANAHLAIPLDDPNDLQQKRFLERFGFRAVGEGIMKRNAGSVTPPSVPTARL